MGISNTPPKKQVAARSNDELFHDLDIALRRAAKTKIVGCFDEVKEVHREIQIRSLPVSDFLSELSVKTGWRMQEFLLECLQYPEVTPHVKTINGVRVEFRCWNCSENERYTGRDDGDEEYDGVMWCDTCLERAHVAVQSKNSASEFVLFTTLTKERRCSHASDQTLLLMQNVEDFWYPAYCEECLLEEKKRRGG